MRFHPLSTALLLSEVGFCHLVAVTRFFGCPNTTPAPCLPSLQLGNSFRLITRSNVPPMLCSFHSRQWRVLSGVALCAEYTGNWCYTTHANTRKKKASSKTLFLYFTYTFFPSFCDTFSHHSSHNKRPDWDVRQHVLQLLIHTQPFSLRLGAPLYSQNTPVVPSATRSAAPPSTLPPFPTHPSPT